MRSPLLMTALLLSTAGNVQAKPTRAPLEAAEAASESDDSGAESDDSGAESDDSGAGSDDSGAKGDEQAPKSHPPTQPHDQPPTEAANEGDAKQELSSHARRLGLEGLTAFGEGDYGQALQLFGQAEEIAHSPVFQLYMARSLLQLEQRSEARALLERIVRDPPESGEPSAWHRARTDAQLELDALAEAPLPSPEPTAASADDLVEPDSSELPPPASAPKLTPHQKGAALAFSLGGAGLIAGVITGGLAIARSNEAKEGCIESSCPPENEAKKEDALMFGRISTATFILAGVGAATGATLLILSPRRSEGAQLRLGVGAQGAWVAGSF